MRVNRIQALKRVLSFFGLMVFVPMAGLSQGTGITSLSQITATDGHYVITQDITGGTPGVATFSGTLEANINPTTKMPYRIKNLSAPLFTTLTGTVKNLVLEDVNIPSTTTGNVGAIAVTMQGTSVNKAVIYNVGILSGSVGGTEHVGGLVGDLGVSGNNDNCYARVINCYSYADITGGSERAGIVGHNYYASKSGNNTIRTMVMNCMFYGDIDYSSGSVYPIYAGKEISNENNNGKLNNYNYFLYEADFSQGKHITGYNRALAAEERYLVHFEFYRYLLNSTRELASWYVFGSVQNDAHDKMLKWVLDKSVAPYPILKEQGKYPSVVNYDPINTFDSETGQMVARTSVFAPNKGKNLGELTVNITIGSGAPEGASIRSGMSQITLQRTDKDIDDYNFNYDKVQLPYYNEVGIGNCTHNKAVTGWKITAMTGGTQGTFTNADQWNGYNFADRSTYAKDLYSKSGQVFSQGAYFDVPEGVTAINIEPYWGTAAYLADAYYDCYGYETSKGVTDFGTHYTDGNSYNICGNDQIVSTSFANALNKVSGPTVYDNAIVLVGNYHQKSKPSDGTKPFTIMSADLDNDNEPDYSFIYNSGKGEKISPIRFDFVNVPGTAMAHKQTSTTYMGIMGNHKWKGWLEVTNTAFIRFSQLEYDDRSTKATNSPVILLGGVVEQMVSTNGGNQPLISTPYIHVGSNVWFKLFNNGCHMDKDNVKTPHVPISVTGGKYEEFYLSGYFRPDAPYYNDNAECYIDGGYFGDVAGSGQEKINGDVTWYVNHAYIENFYGGGINVDKPIAGHIKDTIMNSYIGLYCGGPKFGDVQANKNVTTYAENTTFGTYYGAGYGGTAFIRRIWSPGSNGGHNQYLSVTYPWNDWLCDQTDGHEGYVRGKYVTNVGYAADYEAENFEGSNDKTVARLYIKYASLSLAQTNGVSSRLEGCTVEHNFYGGGKLGAVEGNAVSILNNCTVKGSVFGGGYSASVPTVNVYPAVSKDGSVYTNCYNPEPTYNTNTGLFEKGVRPTPVEYTWSSNGSTDSPFTDNGGSHEIYTDKDLGTLGKVVGEVQLTLKGNTLVQGSVFGGGDASSVSENTFVYIKDKTKVSGSIYGGGNMGTVGGDTKVIVNGQ